jgi:hypothetical protein
MVLVDYCAAECQRQARNLRSRKKRQWEGPDHDLIASNAIATGVGALDAAILLVRVPAACPSSAQQLDQRRAGDADEALDRGHRDQHRQSVFGGQVAHDLIHARTPKQNHGPT